MFSKPKLRTLVHVALLIALEVVLSRFFSIPTQITKIGFAFVPLAVCGMLYGPVWAGVAGALADVIGAVLLPIGPYFPGFTLSTALTGVVFGLFLFKKPVSWPSLIAAVCINCLGVSLVVNTLWLVILYGTHFPTLLVARLAQCAIMIPVQLVVLKLVAKPVGLYSQRMRA